MIVGIGTDLVEVARIQRSYERFGLRFATKILHPTELERLGEKLSAKVLAKRFAAKEAVAKTLGTGMRMGVHFSQIAVEHIPSGQPTVRLYGAAAARAEHLGIQNWHLSLTDERQFALAFAIAETA